MTYYYYYLLLRLTSTTNPGHGQTFIITTLTPNPAPRDPRAKQPWGVGGGRVIKTTPTLVGYTVAYYFGLCYLVGELSAAEAGSLQPALPKPPSRTSRLVTTALTKHCRIKHHMCVGLQIMVVFSVLLIRVP